MPFVSELLGKPVVDADGVRAGRLVDLIATMRPEMAHPEVVALVVRGARGQIILPLTAVAALPGPAIALGKRLDQIPPYEPGAQDLFLARDVLDKQIIDTEDVRVVRVNDLELARLDSRLFVANVDIGGAGILRRLGFCGLARRLERPRQRARRPGIISWDAVEMLPGEEPLRLRVPGARLREMDPADLAEIISDLSRADSSRFMASLDDKTFADTLEEVEPDFQASLIEKMPNVRVADILEQMAPDEVADLLAELAEERRRELLRLMEREEAEDVRKLLTYPEDSAGGIMNTEYVAVHRELSAEQAIALLRQTAGEAETIYYVYVVDGEGRLLGVLSLRDLVLARPQAPVTEIMHRRVVSVNLRDSQDDVAQEIAKYNLLAVPVVDDECRMQGIVTADDALDRIIPTAWKKRLPRLYR